MAMKIASLCLPFVMNGAHKLGTVNSDPIRPSMNSRQSFVCQTAGDVDPGVRLQLHLEELKDLGQLACEIGPQTLLVVARPRGALLLDPGLDARPVLELRLPALLGRRLPSRARRASASRSAAARSASSVGVTKASPSIRQSSSASNPSSRRSQRKPGLCSR